MNIEQKDFEFITTYVKANFGINLAQKKHLIEGRLSNYLKDRGFANFSQYIGFVMSDKTGAEVKDMVNRLTTNHTYFYREPDHFKYFQEVVLPFLEENNKERDLRIWSAGCSSGEEAYTLAMIIDDYFDKKKIYWDAKILATDISLKAINDAKIAVYPPEALQGIPQNWKMKYFEPTADKNFKLKTKIKDEVIFNRFNLMEEQFPFKKKFNVIFCRNVMIYFEPDVKRKLVQKFYDNSEKGAYLFIGMSESIDKSATKYSYVKPSVYRKV